MRSLNASLQLLALALLAFAQPATARNVAIVHPVGPVLAGKAGRSLVSDLRVAFGGATSAGTTALSPGVEVEGIGGTDYIGNRRPTDAEVCDRALLDALSKLVLAARKSGANAIVGIVSNYQHHPFDDPSNVECHAGTFKSHVVLKADLVRLNAAPAAPAAVASPALPAGNPPQDLVHARVVPPASGFASANDASAVPIRAEGQAGYQRYLGLPSPKAFVVYEDGGWHFYGKDAEAMTKALDYCSRQGKTCWLYAVDDRVVWTVDPATRIRESRQLAPR